MVVRLKYPTVSYMVSSDERSAGATCGNRKRVLVLVEA